MIDNHEDVCNFGTSEDAPSVEWIQKTEKALGVQLPDDYKWFLNTYGGGEISGEEIYSIYCVPFDEAIGGDITYQNIISTNNISLGKIVLSNTDFGEEFYFKIDGSNQVYLELGNKNELYAQNFIEYIEKRIKAYL
ncbi:MAG: SMI1/KNR4 family protein [Pantoea sp.]|uniref:SMI1/KNR4 family protein n=1 Tax=Pantoea sp. TaxID=69393 RepID=UPI0023A26963|nr:SMI1/KNR4 family protein [Pantoea sp.]MDE1185999.1 SMI1/KNR4 family protein [Pantoea sp.]